MKKLILFAAILFAGVSVVNAADPVAADPVASGTIKLNVNLTAFQSIQVGGTIVGDGTVADGGEVNLNYTTMENYKSGVSTTIKDHLIITSAGQYAVTISEANGTEGFDFSNIKVQASTSASEGTEATSYDMTTLGGGQLLSSSLGTGVSAKYDVTYTGSDNYAYTPFQKSLDGVTNYTTTVTYTIAAQ